MNRNSHRAHSATPDDLRIEVDRTRHELGDTVQALAAKADVRSRAQAKADRVRGQLRERAAQAGTRARDTAHMRRHPGGGGMMSRMSRRSEGQAAEHHQEAAAQARHEKAAAMAQAARDKRILAAAAAALAGLAFLAGRRRYCHHGH
jgi:hypothetical protein